MFCCCFVIYLGILSIHSPPRAHRSAPKNLPSFKRDPLIWMMMMMMSIHLACSAFRDISPPPLCYLQPSRARPSSLLLKAQFSSLPSTNNPPFLWSFLPVHFSRRTCPTFSALTLVVCGNCKQTKILKKSFLANLNLRNDLVDLKVRKYLSTIKSTMCLSCSWGKYKPNALSPRSSIAILISEWFLNWNNCFLTLLEGWNARHDELGSFLCGIFNTLCNGTKYPEGCLWN